MAGSKPRSSEPHRTVSMAELERLARERRAAGEPTFRLERVVRRSTGRVVADWSEAEPPPTSSPASPKSGSEK